MFYLLAVLLLIFLMTYYLDFFIKKECLIIFNKFFAYFDNASNEEYKTTLIEKINLLEKINLNYKQESDILKEKIKLFSIENNACKKIIETKKNFIDPSNLNFIEQNIGLIILLIIFFSLLFHLYLILNILKNVDLKEKEWKNLYDMIKINYENLQNDQIKYLDKLVSDVMKNYNNITREISESFIDYTTEFDKFIIKWRHKQDLHDIKLNNSTRDIRNWATRLLEKNNEILLKKFNIANEIWWKRVIDKVSECVYKLNNKKLFTDILKNLNSVFKNSVVSCNWKDQLYILVLGFLIKENIEFIISDTEMHADLFDNFIIKEQMTSSHNFTGNANNWLLSILNDVDYKHDILTDFDDIYLKQCEKIDKYEFVKINSQPSISKYK